ncbi:MAG: DNA mismatch repair endonuclease MutL [Bacteroidetes bacterium]|nr:DNA mismatch repair endonuclease MutL [Bacteroidota bacterium]
MKFLSDVIKLLPDSVANQIAAGEVVQRPASAVKELLENCLDAGATDIRLLIKDGGSTLIQVIDNGRGMSETDARMCWERHATSKISKAQDLFSLNTYGFRGEALASIAAVAQVEMKTRREQDDAAIFIRIEGSTVLEQSLTSAPVGTSIAVRNLFYNIPARRNFLKSISVETRHILEEFQRQALAHPQIAFSMYNQGSEVYDLKPGTLKQRIADVLSGKKTDDLLSLNEDTELVQITGYVGAPASVRRTRGEQYLYVNGRFIRSPYFQHAIQAAYEGLTEEGSYPLFCLFIHLDPAKVDVNVHPTKTEVKFEDEKHIYNILKAAVRKVLGQFVVQPDLDIFGGMGGLEDFLSSSTPIHRSQESFQDFKQPQSQTRYNPFEEGYSRPQNQDWQKILGPIDQTGSITTGSKGIPEEESLLPVSSEWKVESVFSLPSGYLAAKINGALILVDKRAAHVKVLYEGFLRGLRQQSGHCQQLLFPITIELNQAWLHTALELMDDFKSLGFDVSHFGGNTLMISGIPAELERGSESRALEALLEDYLQTQGDLKLNRHESLALSMARQAAVSADSPMNAQEAEQLIVRLFTVQENQWSPDAKPVWIKFGDELVFELFRKQKR